MMTPELVKLCDELCDKADKRYGSVDSLTAVEWKAADTIEALAAENERLREALQGVVDNCGECGGYGTYPAEETVTGKVLWWGCSNAACKSARQALAGKDEQ